MFSSSSSSSRASTSYNSLLLLLSKPVAAMPVKPTREFATLLSVWVITSLAKEAHWWQSYHAGYEEVSILSVHLTLQFLECDFESVSRCTPCNSWLSDAFRGFQYLGAPFSLHFLRPVMAHPGAPPLPRCAPWRVPAAGSEDCRPPRIVDCPRPPRFGTRPKAHDARPAAWPRRCCRCQVVPSTSRHKKYLKIIRNPHILCKQRMAKD